MIDWTQDHMKNPEDVLPKFDAEELPEGEKRYERLAKCVKDHAFAVFTYSNQDGQLIVDVQTANLLVKVADALNPTNRAKFLAMDLGEMVDVAWKLVG